MRESGLLGRRHSLARRLRALRRDARLRRREGVVVAEGRHLVREALACDVTIEQVVFSDRLRRSPEGAALLRSLAERGVPSVEAADPVIDALQDARSPQPILAVVRWSPRSVADLFAGLSPDPLLVVAHGIQDPGNLGTIVRTADAAGASAFVTVGESADLGHPRTVRASKGSLFRIPAAVDDPTALLDRLREGRIRALGASPRAARTHHAAGFRGAVALFVGSEGRGLPAAVLDRLDETVRVPMRPGVDSLSVGAAAAVLLFEAARQRNPDQDS